MQQMPGESVSGHESRANATAESTGKRNWRRVWNMAALLPGSLVLAFLAGEAILRVVPRRWVPELGSFEFHLEHLCRPSANPRLYYELIPDHPAADVNAAGYRGLLYAAEKPPGVVRIVGIGDSNMYAWQLSEAEGYLRQLERLWNGGGGGKETSSDKETRGQGDKEMRRQADKQTRGQGDKEMRSITDEPAKPSPPLLVSPSPPPVRLQVINLAVPGYNSGEYVEVLQSRALQFDPDLIVVGYDHNDAEPIASARQDSYLMPDDYGDNLLGSQLIRWLWRKARVAQWRRLLADPDAEGNERVDIYFARGPLWDRHVEHLTEMDGVLAANRASGAASDRGGSRSVPVLVFIHDAWITADPDRQSRHYRELHEPLLAEFARLGWHVVDGYDLFQEYMARQRQRDLSQLWISVYPQDGHPNARAHRLIAQELYNAIRREQLLPTAVPDG